MSKNLVRYICIARPDAGKEKKKHELLAKLCSDPNDPKVKEYTVYANKLMEKNWKTVDKLVNNRMKLSNEKEGYDVQVHVEYLDNQTLLFIAMTDLEFGKHHMVSTFLNDFTKSFYQRVDRKEVGDPKSSLEKRCKETIAAIQSRYNASVLNDVNSKMAKVKSTVQENIDISLRNVENMNELDRKADDIYNSSVEFESNASSLRCQQQWNYYKLWLLAFIVLAAVITVIVVMTQKN